MRSAARDAVTDPGRRGDPRGRASTAERRFQNLVALVGTVTRCNCGKRGFLAKVGVSVEPAMRKKTYFAEWEHPHDDGDSSLCEWVWP